MKHVLTASQFERGDIDDIFERADYFKEYNRRRREIYGRYASYQICLWFQQRSTRTRISFQSAGEKLGMGVIGAENAEATSSTGKRESLTDTIKMLNGYADIIVIRHPEENSAEVAAAVSEIPVINAGDGGNEHPTQALLDVYTIERLVGRAENLRIAMGGDLRYGRTVRSLTEILSRAYAGNSFQFIAPESLQLSPDVELMLQSRGVSYNKTESMAEGLAEADVVYWTRPQFEYIDDEAVKGQVASLAALGRYSIDPKTIRYIAADAPILHPLPRNEEISPKIDQEIQAKYFEQAANGVPVRMAIIDRILSDAAAA